VFDGVKSRDWLEEERAKEPTMYTGKKRKYGVSVNLSETLVTLPEFREFILNNEDILLRGVIEDIKEDSKHVFRTNRERFEGIIKEEPGMDMEEDCEDEKKPEPKRVTLTGEAQGLMETMLTQLSTIQEKLSTEEKDSEIDSLKKTVNDLCGEVRKLKGENEQLQKKDRELVVSNGQLNQEVSRQRMLLGEAPHSKKLISMRQEGGVPSVFNPPPKEYAAHITIITGVHNMYVENSLKYGRIRTPFMTYDMTFEIPLIKVSFEESVNAGLTTDVFTSEFKNPVFAAKFTELLGESYMMQMKYHSLFFGLVATIKKITLPDKRYIMSVRANMIPRSLEERYVSNEEFERDPRVNLKAHESVRDTFAASQASSTIVRRNVSGAVNEFNF
jgi:hypothetical protein